MRDCGMPRPVLLQALDALSAAGVIVQGAAVVADSTMIRILPPLGGFRMRQDDGSPNRAVFAPAVHVPDVIQISIRWRGGATRKVECPLPLTAPDLRRTPAALVEQVRVLATEQTDGQIAETLNGRWLRTGCGLPFTSTRVRTLRGSYDIDSYLQHLTTAGWLTVPQMAAQLDVHLSTAKRFAQEGVLRAVRADDKGPGLVNGSRRYRTRESNIPRLLLAWICREAVRTRRPRLILGRSLKEFMAELGMHSDSGGPRSDRTRLQTQMERLFCTSIELISTDKHRLHRVADHVTTHTDLWWSMRRPDEPVLFDSSITLGQAFFDEILRSPVPVDMNVLKALRRSTLGLDLYFWLTCKYFTLAEPVKLRWEQLYEQFGAHPNRPTRIAVQNFRTDAVRELEKIKLAWPQIRYSLPQGALLLMPTKPRIAPTKAPPLRG